MNRVQHIGNIEGRCGAKSITRARGKPLTPSGLLVVCGIFRFLRFAVAFISHFGAFTPTIAAAAAAAGDGAANVFVES